MDLPELIPTRYQVSGFRNGIMIVSRSAHDGEVDSWAICDGMGSPTIVLNKRTLEWVIEPYPSSRTPENVKDIRFRSTGEALECLMKAKAKAEQAIPLKRRTS